MTDNEIARWCFPPRQNVTLMILRRGWATVWNDVMTLRVMQRRRLVWTESVWATKTKSSSSFIWRVGGANSFPQADLSIGETQYLPFTAAPPSSVCRLEWRKQNTVSLKNTSAKLQLCVRKLCDVSGYLSPDVPHRPPQVLRIPLKDPLAGKETSLSWPLESGPSGWRMVALSGSVFLFL